MMQSTRMLCSVLRRGFSSVSSSITYNYETLVVSSPAPRVLQVDMNRPKKGNAMNKAMWREYRECFGRIAQDTSCRAVVLTGAGKAFTSGIDLFDHASMFAGGARDASRQGLALLTGMKEYQESFNVIERCPQPVIAAINGACIGAGIDATSACDIRFCSEEAFFSIKEVDVGLAADMGTLQRFPKIVGNDSIVRELALTGRRFSPEEALRLGFVSRVLGDREELLRAAVEIAEEIASKSPIAVAGTKHNLIYSRDHSVQDGLDHVAVWKASALQSPDLNHAVSAFMTKTSPSFDDLTSESPFSAPAAEPSASDSDGKKN